MQWWLNGMFVMYECSRRRSDKQCRNSKTMRCQSEVMRVLDNAAISGYCRSYLVTLKVCCRLRSTVRLCMNVPFYVGKELFVMMHSQTLLSFLKIKGKFLLTCAWIYSALMSLLSQELCQVDYYAAHIKLLLKQQIGSLSSGVEPFHFWSSISAEVWPLCFFML